MAAWTTPEYHPAFEEYCETIFELAEDDLDVIQARIADRMGISRPAVSEMIRRMQDQGLLEHGRRIKLTDDGMTYAYNDSVLVREYTLHLPFALHDRKSVVAAAGGITWSEQGDSRAGDVTTISSVASPTDRAETLIFVYLSRNHSLDVPDEDFAVGFDEIMEQDRMVVEDQDPLELPLDPREELHLKLADGASIVYRRLLRELAAVPA